MSIGNEFQADGAETAKALSVNRRWIRGVMKSPLDFERSRLSLHGLHSSHKYNGAVPRETRYIKTHSLNLMRLSIGSQCSSLSIVADSGCCVAHTTLDGLQYSVPAYLSTLQLLCCISRGYHLVTLILKRRCRLVSTRNLNIKLQFC